MSRATCSLFVAAAVTPGLLASAIPVKAGTVSAFVSGEAEKAAGSSQSLDDAAAKLDAIWTSLPLQMRRVMFVSEKAPVYGAYTLRGNSVFKPSDTILTYIEPIGYSYQPAADGFVRFGVVLDFEIIQPDGTVSTGKKNFLTWSSASRARMKELMLNASLDFDDFPEGDYVLRYTLHDINNGKTTEANLPFTIAK